jgi:hypothetical protein
LAGVAGEQFLTVEGLEEVRVLLNPALDVLFNPLAVLELAAALVLEGEHSRARALRVRADAPVGAERPLQLAEVEAAA